MLCRASSPSSVRPRCPRRCRGEVTGGLVMVGGRLSSVSRLVTIAALATSLKLRLSGVPNPDHPWQRNCDPRPTEHSHGMPLDGHRQMPIQVCLGAGSKLPSKSLSDNSRIITPCRPVVSAGASHPRLISGPRSEGPTRSLTTLPAIVGCPKYCEGSGPGCTIP